VHPSFVCDGQEDCDDPSDEAPDVCGDPCAGKIYCKSEGRCLAPEWCCPGVMASDCTPERCCSGAGRSVNQQFAVSVENDGVSRTFRPAGKEALGHSSVDYLQTSVFIVMGE
jgi:hypothetical protein